MKKLLFLIVLFLFITKAYSQNPGLTIVATLNGSVATLSVSHSVLKSAFETELNDGTIINQVEVVYSETYSTWYLFAHGVNDTLTINISWYLIPFESNLFVGCSSGSATYTKCVWTCCDDCGLTVAEYKDSCPTGKGHCKDSDCEGTNPEKDFTDGHIGNFY